MNNALQLWDGHLSVISRYQIVNFHNQCISPVIVKYSLTCSSNHRVISNITSTEISLRSRGVLIILVLRHSSIRSWNKAYFISGFRTSFGAQIAALNKDKRNRRKYCQLDLESFKIYLSTHEIFRA